MRFVSNGPSIPDDLLVARDEGRVVFFCGAGVSRARAGLKDFIGLARAVADKLAITSESPARKLLAAMEAFPSISGIGSLISADRIFSQLEREFLSRDIYKAIATSLKPEESAPLTAHQNILDLARGADGIVRLVTTNFDLLFEACNGALPRWRPPRLPDPLRTDEFNGIIHLHGHVTDDYANAAGDGFIISSAEFGRAYLSERWATDFTRTILQKYIVVFVGYAADDPPMQYLLEALNRTAGSLSGVYAFQAGSIEDAQAQWVQKGAHPIPYEESPNHSALWDTLSAWAHRARNPNAWYSEIISGSRSGPDMLQSYQRGQLAHIVSTLEGARQFASSPIPAPASWLCVFDPSLRFARPGRLSTLLERGAFFDPFDAYGLDTDPIPPKIDPNDSFAKREIPPGVWNCFSLTRQDRQNLRDDQFSALRGHWSVNVPTTVARYGHIAEWLCRVAGQPDAVWWAAGQFGLHPQVQQQIRFAIERDPQDFSSVIRKAWRYIFESWSTSRRDFYEDLIPLLATIKVDGWSNALIRQFAAVHRPVLKVTRPLSGGSRPPEPSPAPVLSDLLYLDVDYPSHNEEISVPKEYIVTLLRELRKNLELGVALESEIGGYGLHNLAPIEPDAEAQGETNFRSGISAHIFTFTKFFKQLVDADSLLAKGEATAWQENSDTAFTRLRIWSCGDARIFSPTEVGRIFGRLGKKAFWDSYHQRDLLLTLAKRWDQLPKGTRKVLERKLLQGPPRLKGEKRLEFLERRASQILARIHWLSTQGCQFFFDLNQESDRLREHVAHWQPQRAIHAADSLEGRSGWVKTDTDGSGLVDLPLSSVLNKAAEIRARRGELFVERDPFAGLVATRPVRAYAVLTLAAKAGDYPEWAWRTFLNSEARKTDKIRFIVVMALRLARWPSTELGMLTSPVADWLLKVSKPLLTLRTDIFGELWSRLVMALKSIEVAGESSVISKRESPDWATQALNAPAGYMAQAIMNDPRIDSIAAGQGLPLQWRRYAEDLLGLAGDMRRHALAIFGHNLVWFYSKDPLWAESALLSALDTGELDSDAFWAGFFWGAKVPQQELYLKMKSALLRLASQKSFSKRQHAEVLGAILLAGWGSRVDSSGERGISDSELRSAIMEADDDFRAQLLWNINRWSHDPDSHWVDEALILFREVWPKQIAARTPTVSARLCEIAFSHTEKFPEYVDCILPLVTKVDQDEARLPILRTSRNDVVDKFPDKTLALLSAVLPDDPRKWPYGVNEIIDRIGTADSKLLTDGRLIELKRVWNSR